MRDELWALIEPLLPPWPERSPGPRPVSDRLCLQGILFVLYNDIAWQLLPLELGFGSGQTCWRRLDRWQKAGVFDRLHRVLLAELNAAGELDWSRAAWTVLTSARKRGTWHRSVAGRPAEDGQQAPPDLRRTWHPAQGDHDCGQRQRRHPSNASPSDGNAAPNSTMPSSPSPAASSAQTLPAETPARRICAP
ncbi:transposase [Streptomyces anulatus]|uniref:transposase n=1 Tax=Streptomyces anulatus TaxID=1892 RepID=UPI003B7CF7E1